MRPRRVDDPPSAVIPSTSRIASSMRSTPSAVISVVSSACFQDTGTKLMAARL
jgi:hypothetical protein